MHSPEDRRESFPGEVVLSWNEWTSVCPAVFTWEFIVYCQHVCEQNYDCQLSPTLVQFRTFMNIHSFGFLSFVHLLSCFWDLSKGQSGPLILWQGERLRFGLARIIFQMDWIFGWVHLVFATWHDHKNHRYRLVRLHLHFPFHEILLGWRPHSDAMPFESQEMSSLFFQ